MSNIENIEEIIANSEPLESFELDYCQSFENNEYADQEEIMSALKEMLDRELY